MNFLEKLDYLMDLRGINKSVLSKESGVPYTTIDGFYKKGYEKAKLPTVQRLAKYFNVTLDYLIRDEITDINYGKSHGFEVNYDEMILIKKYRSLTPTGKETVEKTIANLLKYETKLKNKDDKSELLAAHNDDNSKEQQELMRQDLEEL